MMVMMMMMMFVCHIIVVFDFDGAKVGMGLRNLVANMPARKF